MLSKDKNPDDYDGDVGKGLKQWTPGFKSDRCPHTSAWKSKWEKGISYWNGCQDVLQCRWITLIYPTETKTHKWEKKSWFWNSLKTFKTGWPVKPQKDQN